MLLPIGEMEKRLASVGVGELYLTVMQKFRREFPECHDVGVVRAPGRVNIIGEHTDYNGLPVMPMAIDREIVIAFSPDNSGTVEVVATDDTYPKAHFALSGNIPKFETGHWVNYIKAAAQAVWNWASVHCPDRLPLSGAKLCVGGNIPPGSGLSSSSALVVASALVFARDLNIDRVELAELLAKGERYVGTEGGGMDQAASLMGKAGNALKIDFFPLRIRPVSLPHGCLIAVANSMVAASKTGAARIAFNTRVVECRLGLELLKHISKHRNPRVVEATLLKDYVCLEPDWRAALDSLPDGPLTVAQIADVVGVAEGELRRRCLTLRDGSQLTEPKNGFQPKKRCLHVLTEADRVERAAQAAGRGDAVELGRLMNESHSSCAENYEISCPELDCLVDLLRRHGALGARLTGAGFGGCAVALVRQEEAPGLLEAVWTDYYRQFLPTRGLPTPSQREHVLFVTKAVDGACVIEV
ncbi:MAG: galactokinase [Armatimonadota bacterium]|nr:galactokinase [Armatimonadota bacterium]